MNNQFFEKPILNSPYGYPIRHWELDEAGQPTQRIIETRRRAEFITPIPKPKKRKGAAQQGSLVFDEGKGLSTAEQRYDHTAIINSVRQQVDQWRELPNTNDWRVTPETARLLQHWRQHKFGGIRPFFCQIEGVETAIWLTEVAPQAGKVGESFIDHLADSNNEANPELMRFALFRNFDEHGNPFPRPNTLLIDSEQLESGEGLDDNFRAMAMDEIERFRRESVERGGKLGADLQSGKEFDDVTLLREVMNTVGKPDQLGEQIRCVVSVSMLTEGWDANTVTHVLGVRAFGTQLLCEQVIGRALRRQSYELNEDDLFNVEYADVLGIPFDFTAKPVVAPPQPPRETVTVKAVRPERDELEIRFPRVEGYRVELPEERLTAQFNDDSVLLLTPDLVGPTITKNAGIIGASVDLSLKHLDHVRPSTLLFHLTQRLLYTKWRDPGEAPKLHLFGQLKRVTTQWLDGYLKCKGGTYPAQLMYQELADMACERITKGITAAFSDKRPIKAVLDPYNPVGSTAHVRFNTSRTDRWETNGPPPKCHINWVALDSDWEGEFCRVAESHPRVRAYVKNHNLGLEVPYRYGSETRKYLPDFIVRVEDGHGEEDPLNLIAEFTEVYQIESDFEARVKSEFDKMINHVVMDKD